MTEAAAPAAPAAPGVAAPPADGGPVRNYEFVVKMSCGGCSGAVNRVLSKLDGVKSHTADLETQKVHVTVGAALGLDDVKAVIAKTGKEVISAKELGADVKE